MALTIQQEDQLKEFLGKFTETMDLASSSPDILAALGYGDTRVIDLPSANPLTSGDSFYVVQANTDVQATMQQFAQFAYDTFVAPALAAALAGPQTEINNALDPTQTYCIGQA